MIEWGNCAILRNKIQNNNLRKLILGNYFLLVACDSSTHCYLISQDTDSEWIERKREKEPLTQPRDGNQLSNTPKILVCLEKWTYLLSVNLLLGERATRTGVQASVLSVELAEEPFLLSWLPRTWKNVTKALIVHFCSFQRLQNPQTSPCLWDFCNDNKRWNDLREEWFP